MAVWAVRTAVGSVLRPATRFAEVLRKRDAKDLSPVTDVDLPIELAPIPQALNGYLAHIRTHVEAEKQFVTNAAHELRTPIAAASSQAQLIASGLAQEGAPQRLAGALHRLGQLVDRLLQLSRAEAGIVGTGPCDLVQVTRLVTAELDDPVVFDDGDIATAQVAADPDALALILRNLIRNAAEHGRGDVRVTLSPDLTLTITNSIVPGAEFRYATFDKSATSTGAGLGLAIVRRVAETQGLSLDFSMKGERAEVTIRLASDLPERQDSQMTGLVG